MIRNRIWPALLGLVVGLTGGFVIWGHFTDSAQSKGTAALREFSFPEVSARSGKADWQVIEDKIYDAFPPLSRSKRIARRIVAETTVSDTAQAGFIARFQQAAETSLTLHGAVIKGQFDASRSSAQVLRGNNILRQVELPRRYYAIGDVYGVADVWCVAESGRLTFIVSLIEGP